MGYQDLGEHVGALVTLVGLFAGLSGFLLWRLLCRLERKLDEFAGICRECRRLQGERYLSRFAYKVEKEDLWTALRRHDHDSSGRVLR